MRVEQFNYHLPEELIAQTPLSDRASSRLMVIDPIDKTILHRRFNEIVDFLSPGDVLVFNNSKVLPARLYGEKEDTGAQVEVLLTKRLSGTEWEALTRPAKRLKEGSRIRFIHQGEHGKEQEGFAEVVATLDEGIRRLRFDLTTSMEEFLDRMGEMPLPPYIREKLQDKGRYQTVYAEEQGSVAAPTAGLHFTEELLERLRQHGVELRFVTLHVGIGTFRPVKVDIVEEHIMHTETYNVPVETAQAINSAKREGRRVIAVGTTALRTLESAQRDGQVTSGHGDTGIFIYPGYRFGIIDALITNFHLPKSTLLMLVSALMGSAFTLEVYETAVRERYRFFSFGDAMFIKRRHDG